MSPTGVVPVKPVQDVSPGVDLFWLPLGAGQNTRCVRMNGRIFEAVTAGYQHRQRCDLYHAALQVYDGRQRFVIEMAPVWMTRDPDRRVVCEGPVGLRWLGRSRWFRYEVRCWPNGVIPDVAEAVDSPQRLSSNRSQAAQVLALARQFPTATWGRDELGAGEMWNSNSLIAWVLARTGHDMDLVHLPPRGRAPGWSAGLTVAARQARSGNARAGGLDTPVDRVPR